MTDAISPKPILFLLVVFVACAFALFGLSNHAQNNHIGQGEMYSSKDIAAIFYNTAYNMPQKPGQGCKYIQVALCPNAKVSNPMSPNFGKPNPHIKLHCENDRGVGISMLVGYNGVVITGFTTPASKFSKVVKRDACTLGTMDDFMSAVKKALPFNGPFAY